ncbi:MAG TPA: RagB/SusD family nutrient uptake outer membrane protein [Prolixibacteraceae bacterium]|nr:RagB/SusD family nutrient uptake outer membrane protein [Prolixibacteraceae bacterium]
MKKIFYFVVIIGFFTSCNYLDVVPDNVATLDNAFADRNNTERFLFTCYSYLPDAINLTQNIGFYAGDELWDIDYNEDGNAGRNGIMGGQSWRIGRGEQNSNNPYCNAWDGSNGSKPYYQAIRNCNIFLGNVDKPKDLSAFDKLRWIAETKFLKAYFHYELLRMYGPIPILDVNLEVSASPDVVKVYREPVDTVVAYIVGLIDEALPDLPPSIANEGSELGRITQSIALAVKAQVLVLAASPLFNGNPDYSNTIDSKGRHLFSTSNEIFKWQTATVALKAAIDAAENNGVSLYYFTDKKAITDSTRITMNIRGSVTSFWGSEIIWGFTNNISIGGYNDLVYNAFQAWALPKLGSRTNYYGSFGAPTMRTVEQFYSSNGVPIDEDNDWIANGWYANRFSLSVAGSEDRFYIKAGAEVPYLHLNREPRFYADLVFDRSLLFTSNDKNDKNLREIKMLAGQISGRTGSTNYSVTGYYPKKLFSYKTEVTDVGGGAVNATFARMTFPRIRLGDLYLLYAEALNEANSAPTAEVYNYVDRIRTRAGLSGVIESWELHSNEPSKPLTQAGMREIIHTERLIELAYEGFRFWDLRRWKEAQVWLNKPIRGWNTKGIDNQTFYQVSTIHTRIHSFTTKDYLWPISSSSIDVNKNLTQSPYWE